MHADIGNSYRNWSTPLAIGRLLQKLYTEEVLRGVYFDCLDSALLGCATGADKLRAGIPAAVRFGHKTGHSDRTTDGVRIAETDAGVVHSGDGERYYLAVLLRDSRESDRENARLMARIAGIVYRELPSAAKSPAAASVR